MKRICIVAFVIFLCAGLVPCHTQALTLADAVEPLIPESECSLTISCCYGDRAFSGEKVELYKIADVSAVLRYTLTQPFIASAVPVNGIRTAGEWDVIRSTLESHILSRELLPNVVRETDVNGEVCFDSLGTGMYLAIIGDVIRDDIHCRFDSVLISLPDLGQDRRWHYHPEVCAKAEELPPITPDEKIELRVVKLWRGDEGRSDRPESVEVDIYRNGAVYETVSLSEANNWTHTWDAYDDGAQWTVAERNVPDGYVAAIDARETSFVLTNTWTPDVPDDPIEPPDTGDTNNILPYVLLFAGAGCLLLILGIGGKRLNV